MRATQGYKVLGHLVCSSGLVVEFYKCFIIIPVPALAEDTLFYPDLRPGSPFRHPNGSEDLGYFSQDTPPVEGDLDLHWGRLKRLYKDRGIKLSYSKEEFKLVTMDSPPDPYLQSDTAPSQVWVLCHITEEFGAQRVRGILEGESPEEGVWRDPRTLVPMFIPTLIDLINENNKTFVFEGTYSKDSKEELGKKHKKVVKRKKKRPILPAYYVIDISPKVMRKYVGKSIRKGSSGTGRTLTHRHDRDGHERLLVQRGELPLLDDDRQLLLLRGYDVYADTQPVDENKRRLVRRRLPLRHEGEWLAIKTSWVNSTVVGDELLPYKPALRRLTANSIVDLLKSNTKGDPSGFKSI